MQDKAIAAFRVTEEKTVAGGQKLDILFALLRLGFFYQDDALIERTLERAKTCASCLAPLFAVSSCCSNLDLTGWWRREETGIVGIG